jgi:hypothetical protein
VKSRSLKLVSSTYPREEMAKLRDWFLELDHKLWDVQIASGFNA